jgi:long-chain acyl-CoA synthetase
MTTAPDTILGAIAHHALSRPDAVALQVGDASLSWRELAEAIAGFAAVARTAGAASGDRVGVLAAPSLAGVAAYLGAISAGCVAVPLPLSLREAALEGLLEDCAPTLLVADAGALGLLAPHRKVDIVIAADGLPGWSPVSASIVPNAAPDAAFNIIYSSGTTGRPKGIVHSHGMRNGSAARRAFALGPTSLMLLSTPLYSNTTLVPMLAALFHGAMIRLMPKFDAGQWLAFAEGERVTHAMLVPVQYRRLLDHPDSARRDLSALALVQCTSAPFDVALKREVLARWPGRLLEVYGLTEGGVSTGLDARAHPDKLHTVGRPADGVDLRIIDAAGQELPQGETGEIVGHSPWMMNAYWHQPEQSAAIRWIAPDGRVFHRSGDLGALDTDGFLTILGRKKELIISGGFNIYPVDLEAVLLSHPDVLEAAVVGVPSREWGETPVAGVVMAPGISTDETALLEWANARLGRMQRLKRVAILPGLPRSSIGKVLKADLAQLVGGVPS